MLPWAGRLPTTWCWLLLPPSSTLPEVFRGVLPGSHRDLGAQNSSLRGLM